MSDNHYSQHVSNLTQLLPNFSQKLISRNGKQLQKVFADIRNKSKSTPILVIKVYIYVLLLSLQFDKSFASNLPLLSGTLRTFQVHACDGEELRLECLPNTVISIYLAQYGRTVPSNQLCPSTSPSLQSLPSHNTSLNINDTNDCLSSDALRYSLLQKVESSCREQRICKFMTSPQSFGGIDPCPGVRKYAEIAFKCRPNTFYNKIICAGDRLRLKCSKTSRIVIYSATFGSTLTGVPECPNLDASSQPMSQSLKPSEECQVSYATETVMSSCHGRKKCSLDADIGTFGDPGCQKSTRLHLKVVYTCVPRDVLKELDIGVTDNDKSSSNSDILSNEDNIDTSDYTGFVEEPRYIPEPEVSSQPYPSGHIDKVLKANKEDLAISPTKNTHHKSDGILKNNFNIANNNSSVDSDVNCTLIAPPEKVIGFISDWISAVNFIKKNTERFVLYLLVSLCGSLVCFLVVLSSRLFIQKKRVIKKAKDDMPACSPFGALNDDPADDILDQLDGVTTLTEPLNHSHHHNHSHHVHHPSIEVVRYSTSNGTNTNTGNRNSSIRRQNSDTNPRSLSRNLNNYYYN